MLQNNKHGLHICTADVNQREADLQVLDDGWRGEAKRGEAKPIKLSSVAGEAFLRMRRLRHQGLSSIPKPNPCYCERNQ